VDRKKVITIFLIVFVNFMGASIVQPVLPLYAGNRFGASPETISLLLASFFAAQFLAAPVLGRISDRRGRLPVLIVSQIGTFISFLILGGAESLTVLFLGRILDGITGGNVIVAQAYLTDIAPRKQRTQALGVVFSAFGLGYILGPAIGGFVSAAFGDRAAFLVAATVSLVTVLITWLMLDESLTPEKRQQRRENKQVKLGLSEVLANSSLLICMLIGFGGQFSIALLTSTIAMYGEHVIFAGQPLDMIHLGNGLMLTGFGFGQIFTQFVLVKPLVKRFGEHRLVVIGAVLRSMSLFSIALIVSPFYVGGFALPLVAIASGIMMPSLQSIATTTVPEEVNGGALGWYQSAASMGIIIGTAMGGRLFASDPALPFIIGGITLALTLFPAITLMRRQGALPAPSMA